MDDSRPRHGAVVAFVAILGLAVVLTFEATRFWVTTPVAETAPMGREPPLSFLGRPSSLPPPRPSTRLARPPTAAPRDADNQLRRVSRPGGRRAPFSNLAPDTAQPPPATVVPPDGPAHPSRTSPRTPRRVDSQRGLS